LSFVVDLLFVAYYSTAYYMLLHRLLVVVSSLTTCN
jgi:hypothetical protein